MGCSFLHSPTLRSIHDYWENHSLDILFFPFGTLPPSIFASNRVFSNESVLRIMWLKYWSFSSSISPTNEYSGLISFRIDWFDLFEVQGTLKSLLQHHNSQVAKKLPANAGGMRCRFDLWVGKIPWSRAWQLTPIFLPGELHGQRSLVVYSPWRHKELDTTEVT